MSDALSDAQTLYTESLDALRDQRRQISEDLAFSDPSNPQQWEDDVRRTREADPGGKRACLTLDQCGQYVANVAGQVEKQPPSLHAIPVGGGADQKAAEQIDGRFRHIEYASKAQQHYARALTSAARAGVGYLIVRPEYVNRALNWQEPRISSEPDPLKVVFDPWSTETDGSDATDGFLLTNLSLASFEAMWPKKSPVDFGDIERRSTFDDRKSVIIAEQWSKDTAKKNVVVYWDENNQEQSETVEIEDWKQAVELSGLPYRYHRSYTDKVAVVKWRKMSGADILEESDYPAESIGIVPVYGYVGFADGRMKFCGIPRRARSAQQAYNYHKSELMMPGGQLIASKRALAGMERIWDQAQTQRRAFLPYNDFDDKGVISQPGLIKVGSQLVDHAAAAETALHDLQASIGMYQANIGAQSNAVSGVAYDAQKQQGEASTSHFPSHLAASLGQVGAIVMQMDARLSDTQRKQPIIGVDRSAGSVNVDPKQREAFKRSGDGVSINPKVGSYGVRVEVGASYATQRKETNAAFSDIMRGNPDMAPTVAPFWAQTLDFPGADKFAQALAAMAPDPVKAILQPEGGDNTPDPAALAQQLAQCQAALKEAVQHAHDAQEDADKAVAGLADKAEENRIRDYEAETNRLKVTGANDEQIKAIVNDLVNDMLSQEAPLPGDTPETGMDPALRQQSMPEPMPAPAAAPEPVEEPMPTEPPPPAPEILQMLDGQQQITQGQQQIAELIQALIKTVSKPRKRVPHRDPSTGDILHVTDSIEE